MEYSPAAHATSVALNSDVLLEKQQRSARQFLSLWKHLAFP